MCVCVCVCVCMCVRVCVFLLFLRRPNFHARVIYVRRTSLLETRQASTLTSVLVALRGGDRDTGT